MGLISRAKEAPSGLKQAIDDVFNKGVLGGVLVIGQRFSEKNAAAFNTLGEDIKR